MKQILQIILDTNILVAAFRSRRGAANLLLDKRDDSRWQVNVSTALRLKYEDVLKRPKMNDFILERDVDVFLNGLFTIAEREDMTLDQFIALALASQVSSWNVGKNFAERAKKGDSEGRSKSWQKHLILRQKISTDCNSKAAMEANEGVHDLTIQM